MTIDERQLEPGKKSFNPLKKKVYHGGAKPPLKCFIKAKIKYLLHFFSFLDQTCQIDYDC